MLALVLFRVASGARALSSVTAITEGVVEQIDRHSARAELLPLLPPQTKWPEGDNDAEWSGADNCMELNVGKDSVGLRVLGYRGEVLAALRRIHDTNRWILVSLESGDLFDFDDIPVN